ncbi:MAG: hypothetical protein U1F66_01315 [bacterium]
MSKILRIFWLGCLAWALAPSLSHAAPRSVPNLDAWLYQNPDLSGKIVWEFPKEIPELPAATVQGVSPWLSKVLRAKTTGNGGLSSQPAAGASASANPPCDPNRACAIPVTASLGDALTLQWYYWPNAYKQRLRTHFARYWNWLEEAWPLYQQYQASGFAQKPAGFDAKFASPEDPDPLPVQDPPPFVVEVLKDNYTHVLYEGEAAFDTYARGLALQLALELGGWLPWRLNEYDDRDLSILLDGRSLFRYVPAGAKPWGGQQAVNREGYDAQGSIPAPPLLEMKFLARSGLLRESRFATVEQLLEWERANLRHAMGGPQDLVGECGKEFSEVYWGAKGYTPISRQLNGTVMACTLVPTENGGSQSPFFDPNLVHWTGGCGGTAFLNHRVLRQVNLPAEFLAFTHAQTRFSLEKSLAAPFLNDLEAQLPPEPVIDDGLLKIKSLPKASLLQTSLVSSPSNSSRTTVKFPLEKGSSLASAYLDHADNPYGLQAVLDIPALELLVSEEIFQRWFRKAPDWLGEEQRQAYNVAHNKYVSLRPSQLLIHHLPERMLKYYCYYDEPAGHSLAGSKVYTQFFSGSYTVEELEAMGFWPKLLAKVQGLGGCEAIPPLW